MSVLLTKLESLPELLNSKDLVTLGLYPTKDSVYIARLRGKSPDYVQIGHKVLYPKKCVLEFLERHFLRGDNPRATSATYQNSNV